VISEKLLRQHEQRVSDLVNQLTKSGCEIVPVPDGVMLELAEGRNSGALVGLCALPVAPTLTELASRSLAGAGPVVVLVDVEEPGNVGALCRSALAAGASGLVSVGVSDPFHPKAVRTAMGSVFKLPIARSAEVGTVVHALANLRRFGAVAQGGAVLWHAVLPAGCALFIGNEANGLSAQVMDGLDQGLTVPMREGVDSFSVNAAAAIILYEMARQRATG
jgi:TrmH family RNA methyltransferase